MCRPYGFRSSQHRKVECELIEAQNSLLRQILGDAAGQVHGDGWGLGHDEAAEPKLARQPTAASRTRTPSPSTTGCSRTTARSVPLP